MNPLWAALAFILFTFSASMLARRLGSWLAAISAAAFAYCALAQVIHFALQFVPDSRSLSFGGALVTVWLLWPVIFLVAAIVSVIFCIRTARSGAP
jgi:hypothetical protein